MKWRNSQFITRTSLVAGAMLIGGAINLLPWRTAAQEPSPPGPANNRAADAEGVERAAPRERSRDNTQAPAGQPRFGRAAPAARMLSPSPDRMSASRPPAEVAPARFEVAVYEVQVPEGRVADLEAQRLEAKAATPQELAGALQEFGKTRVLYKIDQTVNLYGESIVLTSNEPMVTGSRQMDSGSAINTITYQQVGLTVNLSASPPPPESPRKGLDVQVNVELSTLADSGVEIAPKVRASSIRTMQLSHSETPRFGKPLVLLNVSASGGGEKVQPVAHVVRYVFREIKP